MPPELPPIPIVHKSGQEPFHHQGVRQSFNVLDFWRWSSSDLLSNATRGIVAEYLVACDLGVADGVRSEWDPYDLTTSTGIKVEVKASAYLQSWNQPTYSTIQFSIAPTKIRNTETGKYETEKKRQNDVYVFCLLHHKDMATVDPLDVAQWTFYVLPTRTLNERVGSQLSLSLSRLHALNPQAVPFGQIKVTLENMVVDMIDIHPDNAKD